MSHIANQYNYATPLSSSTKLTDSSATAIDLKYFTLSDNTLNGDNVPISGDVGLWGTSISDDNGILQEPFVITVTETLDIHSFKLVGSEFSYPVDFTVNFYHGSALVYSISETGNTNHNYSHYLGRILSITRFIVTITRISEPNTVARVYRTYASYDIRRNVVDTIKLSEASSLTMDVFLNAADRLAVKVQDSASHTMLITSADVIKVSASAAYIFASTVEASDSLAIKHIGTTTVDASLVSSDSPRLKAIDSSAILNTIDVTHDNVKPKIVESISHPTVITSSNDSCSSRIIEAISTAGVDNIHSIMKAPERHIYGKVYITYTDPLVETSTPEIEVNSEAYNSQRMQIIDGETTSNLWFTLYDNNLSGDYRPSDESSQVGWTSAVISDASGVFAVPPVLELSFVSRPIATFTIFFDDSHGCVAEDFTVEFTSATSTKVVEISGNTEGSVTVPLEQVLIDIQTVKITVNKVTKPFYPVSITDVPIVSTFLYKGYQDTSDLISIDLLEELTYNDEVEALGGVSANEVTVKLDNSSKYFNINNMASPVARQLRRNRKIEPYLGAEIVPGEIEWYRLGIFWSYSWDVPFDSLTASVTGFDTIGLIGTTSFTNHHVQVNKSIGFLADYILTDAATQFKALEWYIASELYTVIIPYAWFEAKSHTKALKKLSEAYPLHIYCDRNGRILVMPQKLHLDYYYDVWSDDTNVISKDYSSLYTVLPNIINVTAISPILKHEELVNDTSIYAINGETLVVLNFIKPYVSDISVSVDADSSVSYSYVVYSWGIELIFNGSGTVRGIACNGNALDTTNKVVYTKRNAESIRANGAVTRDVSADFIQTSEVANTIIDRLFELSKHDIYDAEVTYRGDISLTINDPILLQDSIAPDNRYNIKRHSLYWDGSLTGTADLNT